MKQIIRLTESELHQIVANAVNRILQEDGGDGATNSAGLMVGNSDSSGGVAYPAFGGKSKKKGVGGNPWKEPIMRQKHNLGDVTQAKANQVDMKPALDRTPGFSMGERKK